MAGTDFSDELLMSFVDGEVDPAAAAHIEAAMIDDPLLAARVEMFIQTRALARSALVSLGDEPVPASLAASVADMIERHKSAHPRPDGSGKVIGLRSRRPPPSSMRVRRWAVPLAASVALMMGAGMGGFWFGARNASPQLLSLGSVGDPTLSHALGTLASGGEAEIAKLGRVRMVSSFRDGDGGLCREGELKSPHNIASTFVACRRRDIWTMTFALALPDGDENYVPAGSAETLDAYLAAIEASPPLEAAEEAKALGTLR